MCAAALPGAAGGAKPHETCPAEEHDGCCQCRSDEKEYGDWDTDSCCGDCTNVCAEQSGRSGPPSPSASPGVEGFSYVPNDCPLNSTVQLASGGKKAEYFFCGTRFVAVKTPTWLANFRAIAARPDDVIFATQPPAGKAKEAGLGLIKAFTGAREVSGHTEFYDFEMDPSGSGLNLEAPGRRLFGTHVSFEWLPTSILSTPAGQSPCKVVMFVREPKEYIVAANDFAGGGSAGIDPLLERHVGAALGSGDGEMGAGSRGFAAFTNGYSAALDGSGNGGPNVFLLSQTHLANPSTVKAEVARLAAFLGILDYQEQMYEDAVSKAQSSAATALGSVGKMTAEQAETADTVFKEPLVDQRATCFYSSTMACEGMPVGIAPPGNTPEEEEEEEGAGASSGGAPRGRGGGEEETGGPQGSGGGGSLGRGRA